MEEDKKYPDFNEWLLTEDGLSCNDLSSLKEQQYLQNRLFWAFDAGRDRVWQQYILQKRETERLTALNEAGEKVSNSFENRPMHDCSQKQWGEWHDNHMKVVEAYNILKNKK